jgi:hypothetical protein
VVAFLNGRLYLSPIPAFIKQLKPLIMQMLDLINFVGAAVAFNLLFFLYASTKMKNKLHPIRTTVFAFLFNIPLSIILATVYTIMLVYAAIIGASEEWVWEYMEHNNASE